MDRRQGKQAAFAEALETQLGSIYSYFRRLGVAAAAAEDLAQETFVLGWQHLPELRDERKLRGWLYRIAYRLYLKQRGEAATVRLEDRVEAPAGPADEPGSDQHLNARAIRHALRTLPEAYLHPLLLIYWSDLSYQETARALSLPLGTVAWRVHKALALLRAALAEKGAGDETRSSAAGTAPAGDSFGKG